MMESRRLTSRISSGGSPNGSCPTSTHEGWLWKQGKTIKSWKWRYVILEGDELRYYTRPPSPSKPTEYKKGVINLSFETSIIPCDIKDRGEFCFSITHPTKRSFYLQAANIDELVVWLEVLRKSLPKAQRRYTSALTEDYQNSIGMSTRDADEMQFALHELLNMVNKSLVATPKSLPTSSTALSPLSGDGLHASGGAVEVPACPLTGSEVVTHAHAELFAMEKMERDWTVCKALATIVAATNPFVWHDVELVWHDTSSPLGIDFGMQQGGNIVVKRVDGAAAAQNPDISVGDIVVALNDDNVKGWTWNRFMEAIRLVKEPESHEHDGSALINFMFARKMYSDRMVGDWAGRVTQTVLSAGHSPEESPAASAQPASTQHAATFSRDSSLDTATPSVSEGSDSFAQPQFRPPAAESGASCREFGQQPGGDGPSSSGSSRDGNRFRRRSISF